MTEQDLRLFCEALQLADNLTKKYGANNSQVITLLSAYWLISDRGRLRKFALVKAVFRFCRRLAVAAYDLQRARGSAKRFDA